jgi:glucan 1,3-beta-glucosidase
VLKLQFNLTSTFLMTTETNGTSGYVTVDNNGIQYSDLSKQSNFYRQIRNFNIDISASTTDSMAGLHWQVGQGTSLMYIAIFGSKAAGNNQRLMFTENGSSGFMSDVDFYGGKYGLC